MLINVFKLDIFFWSNFNFGWISFQLMSLKMVDYFKVGQGRRFLADNLLSFVTKVFCGLLVVITRQCNLMTLIWP